MIDRLVKNKYFKIVSLALGFLVVFLLGLEFGNGYLSFNWNNESGNLPSSVDYSLIKQEYSILKNNYDGKLTSNTLEDGILNGLANATGDVHTNYYNATQAKEFTDELNNTFSGIGAELDNNSSNQVVVVSTLAGTPAAKAGLQTGDIINSINGKTTQGESIDNAVSAIHGPSGSTVTLGITRNSSNLTIKIVRANIVVPSVNYKILDNNIGYINIISFANDTPQLAQQAANDFKQHSVKGVILDLRGNPGGLVTSAVSVCSLWLPQGSTIMTEKHDNQVVQTYQSTGGDILNGIPTVVLINSGSASASEITAGALKDNHVATLIGEKSYGKGSVQQIFNLSGGREVKVTIAHWFTPSNINIDK
ncbi:MAG TPA: S41 family peptidase, partial [Candidatus Saccharimonadales bacterium]